MSVLVIDNVYKFFGGLCAVKGVQFSISEGELVALIGSNGAGKTSLLNVISGLFPADRGEIQFKGTRINRLSSSRRCHMGIARTFQLVRLFHGLSVLDNVTLGAQFGSRRFARGEDCVDAAHTALAFVGLANKSQDPISGLTIGQRKLVELARALASGPTLLLIDELMAGLNPAEDAEVMEKIRRIRETGVTILLVEHVMRVVMQLADRIAVLDHGELLAYDTPAKIRENQKVVEAYLGPGFADQGI